MYFGTWGVSCVRKPTDSPDERFRLRLMITTFLFKITSSYINEFEDRFIDLFPGKVSLEHAQNWLRFHPSNSWIGNRIPGPSPLHCDRSHGHWRGIGPIHTVLGPAGSEFAGGQSLQETPLYQIRKKKRPCNHGVFF